MLASELSTQCSLFADIPPTEVAHLLQTYGYAERTYPAKSFLAMQGDACRTLFVLYRGQIDATMINKEGRRVVIERFGDYAVLAPAFLFATHNAFPVHVETRTACTVLAIGRTTLTKMLHNNATMMENYLREISDKCAVLTMRLKEFALSSLRDRLLQYLRTHEQYEKQQDIADRFGVARPSLNKALQELSAEGIIKMEHGKIKLIRPLTS